MSCGEQVVVRETQAASCGNELIEDHRSNATTATTTQPMARTDGCKVAVCGDAIPRTDLEPGEEGFEACDDGGVTSDEDACVEGCALAVCGDGLLRLDLGVGEIGFEACDDGNTQDDDGCRADRQVAVCGDGVVRTDLMPGEPGYEACDDGNEDGQTTAMPAPRRGLRRRHR